MGAARRSGGAVCLTREALQAAAQGHLSEAVARTSIENLTGRPDGGDPGAASGESSNKILIWESATRSAQITSSDNRRQRERTATAIFRESLPGALGWGLAVIRPDQGGWPTFVLITPETSADRALEMVNEQGRARVLVAPQTTPPMLRKVVQEIEAADEAFLAGDPEAAATLDVMTKSPNPHSPARVSVRAPRLSPKRNISA